MFKNHSVIVRRAEQALMLAFAFSLCVCTWAEGRSRSISSSVIRLHVLAASDDAEEQALKLRVRDAVLEEMDGRLRGASSVSDAEEIILASLDDIARAAFAASEGRNTRSFCGQLRHMCRPKGTVLYLITGFGIGSVNWRTAWRRAGTRKNSARM